ncbi:hypothetical protein SAMN04488089_12022 [Myroides profundi]|uniref:Uncharacterized protein n=1 Tax=Myroides profundi TaxID=480520 RepID=A0AAJ4W6U5_MYRPR|nr:hypothetical protein MPR_1296 [Myroides profundi]SER58382.1 hypothetical protein SAMN04488089_12022 [Myroides profundi]
MLYSILLYATLLMGCMPIVLFISGRKHKSIPSRSVVPLISLMAFSSLYECVVSLQLKVSVLWWYQIYSFLEFSALYYLFSHCIRQRPKAFFKVSLGLFLLFYVLSIFYFNTKSVFLSTSINKTYITLFVLVCSFLWIREISNEKQILKLYKEGLFYVIMGLFFYYSTTISLFMLISCIDKDDLYIGDFWLVNVLANLILRITLLLGIWRIN